MSGKDANILVVEDDPAIKEYICTTLGASGYSTIAAKDGIEALRLIDASGDGIKVVMLDVVMPRMNGRELADTILKTHPRIKIIFMSGYSRALIDDITCSPQHIRFLKKPFTDAQLLDVVRAEINCGQ